VNHVNYDDVRAQLAAAGLILDKELTFDARIQRWKTDGKGHEKNGWSRLREWTSKAGNVYIVGAFGVWQGTDDGYTKVELPRRDDKAGDKPALSAEDLAAMREAQKAAAKKLADERRAETKTAARWAAAVWAHCAPCTEHEYTTRKAIKPHGLRVLADLEGIALPGIDDSNWYRLTKAIGALVVPMHDANANVCGVQFIYPKGHERAKKIERDKEFWPSGMAMGGTFGLIGHVNRAGFLLVAEGYATAASLHEATGQSVAYAFSANNLAKAAKLLRKVYPRLRLLFCADDDYLQRCAACGASTPVDLGPACQHCKAPHLRENAGLVAAVNATAELEHAAWVKPDFADEAGTDRRNGRKFTDYNDLSVLTGLPLHLANQVNAKLDALKWREPQLERAQSSSGGAGTAMPSFIPVAEAVSRFAMVYGSGGSWFDGDEHILVPLGDVSAMLPEHGMRDLRLRKRVVRVSEVGFDPAETDPRILCNLWGGWPTVPKEGKCEVLLELLEYLCSGEDKAREVFQWVLRWIAYPLQHPGAKMRTALVLHGPQGAGKNLFFETLMSLYGEYGRMIDQPAIEDRFNDWASRKLFLVADEVVARQELYHIKNKLKSLITGEWIRINPKNVAAHDERNHVNIVFLSNEHRPLILEKDDRRYVVIWTPPELPKGFYADVAAELAAGGAAALHHHLLQLDLGDFGEHAPAPMTRSKAEVIDGSLDSVDRFIRDWSAGEAALDVGGAWEGEKTLPFCPCGSGDLYKAYLRYAKREGVPRPRESNQFAGHLAKLADWKKVMRDRYETASGGPSTRQRFIIPSEADLSRAAAAGLKDYRQQPGETGIAYLTNCFFDFRSALTGA
jgi:putative DNA primase/helicase